MARIPFEINEYYHVYNRGVEKRSIVGDNHDRNRFMRLLFLCNGTKPIRTDEIPDKDTFSFDRGETLTDIGAYCLMGNHFHLLLHERIPNGISTFMQKMTTAYTMYFNRKNERTGVLFQGTFKAKHLNYDEYLKYMFAYVHLNPVEHIEPEWKENGIQDFPKAKAYLARYFYSSYPDYVGTVARAEVDILNRQAFPEYFEDADNFKFFIRDWLAFGPSLLEDESPFPRLSLGKPSLGKGDH